MARRSELRAMVRRLYEDLDVILSHMTPPVAPLKDRHLTVPPEMYDWIVEEVRVGRDILTWSQAHAKARALRDAKIAAQNGASHAVPQVPVRPVP